MKRLFALVVLGCMCHSCSEDEVGTGSFMTATVNSLLWISDKAMAAAQLDFSEYANGHNLWFGGRMQNPLADGTRYHLSVRVNSPVSKGKFYFNNTMDEASAIGGVSGNVIGYKQNTDYFLSSSINGFFIQIGTECLECVACLKKRSIDEAEYPALIFAGRRREIW